MKTKHTLPAALCSLFATAGFTATPDDGSVLPFPPTPSASKAGPPCRNPLTSDASSRTRLPKDAPNVLIILIDDVGFGTPTPSAVSPTHRRSRNCATRASATTASTPPLFARRRAPRSSPGETCIVSAAAPSPNVRWIGTATAVSCRSPRQLSRRCYAITATRPRRSANGITRPPTRPRDGSLRQVAYRLWLRLFLRLHRRGNLAVGTAPV